jgi:hypothetical protein
MERIKTLRDQAELLRRLAASFDAPEIKADLQSLAERCESLAETLSRKALDQQTRPIADLANDG